MIAIERANMRFGIKEQRKKRKKGREGKGREERRREEKERKICTGRGGSYTFLEATVGSYSGTV